MSQVKELSKKGLQRQYAVTVPKDDVESKLTAHLEQIQKTARQPGFRPGKVPMPLLRQIHGKSARAEILDRAISEATEKALAERNLRPAMQPKIELVSFAEDADLEFTLAVEVLPDITPGDFSKIALTHLTAEVEDKIVEDAITRAAKATSELELVTENRAAKMGDVVVIDFDGSVDGKPQPGMKGEGHKLELGSKSFIDTFEEQLVGSKAGDKKTIKVTFPAEYHAPNLAGKAAEFAVTVKELRAPKPIVMDDALAKELGFPSLEKLRERIKEDIGANYKNVSRMIIKRDLMDKLADGHDFEVPAGMLDSEFNSIWQQVEAGKAKGELPEEDKGKSDEDLRKEYRAIAERRIRLGLLLAEVARSQKISVGEKELRGALIAEAQRFPGQEKAVIDYYTQTQGAIERLRAPLLEEKVVDYILTQTKVTEKKIPAEELLKKTEEVE
jgi:trigger factor